MLNKHCCDRCFPSQQDIHHKKSAYFRPFIYISFYNFRPNISSKPHRRLCRHFPLVWIYYQTSSHFKHSLPLYTKLQSIMSLQNISLIIIKYTVRYKITKFQVSRWILKVFLDILVFTKFKYFSTNVCHFHHFYVAFLLSVSTFHPKNHLKTKYNVTSIWLINVTFHNHNYMIVICQSHN